MVFRLPMNHLGTLLLAGTMKVKGPGSAFFISLKMVLLSGRV